MSIEVKEMLTNRAMWHALSWLVTAAWVSIFHSYSPDVQAGKVEVLGEAKLSGDIKKSKNLSGIAFIDDYLIVGSDEGRIVQFLKREARGAYKLDGQLNLEIDDRDAALDEKEKQQEIDIEGLAVEGRTLYVLGSHARDRNVPKDGSSAADAWKELAGVDTNPSRKRLFRVELDGSLKPSKIDQMSLEDAIAGSSVLERFLKIPSKENGIDIEGLAVKDGLLFAGFRGPVLRGNRVPVMRFRWGMPHDATIVCVRLGGLGIRDMVVVKDGFLILAGPLGDAEGPYVVYLWDGSDMTVEPAGQPSSGEHVRLIGPITPPKDPEGRPTKAEGLALIKESALRYEVLVVFDGAKGGGAQRLELTRK